MAKLDIYRDDDILVTVSIGETSAVREVFFMGDDRIKLSFDYPEAIDFLPYDYIIHNGKKYSIKGNDMPSRREAGKRRFSYEAVFKAPWYRLHDMPLSHLGESKFDYFGTPSQIMQLVLDCMEEIDDGFEVDIDEPEDIEPQLMYFDNVTCRQAITQIAEQFQLEYLFDGHVIYMAKSVGNVLEGFTFSQGKGNGLYSLTEIPVPDQPFATRFYGFGGSENLPSNYKDGRKNLVMTGEYVDKNVDLYGLIVQNVYFEDIIPTRTGTLTAVSSDLLSLTDSSLDFDLNDQEIDGAKIVFMSGELGGQEFEIASYNHTTKTIRINRKEETEGYFLPNETFSPAVGDKYKLIGIVMPESYITAAEDKVAEKTLEYSEKHSHPSIGFELEIDELELRRRELVGEISVGTSLHVKSDELKVDRYLRVTELSYPLSNPSKVTAKIGDVVTYTVAEKIIRDVNENRKKLGNVERTQEEQTKLIAKRTGAKFVTLVGDQVFTYQDDISNIVDKEYITLTATEYNFTGAPEDRKWQYLYNGLWIDIPGTFNTLTYNLHHQSAIWHGGDSVVIRYSVGEVYDQITIIKVYKGVGELKVVVQSDYGDIFINGNVDTTLRAYAYWGGELINDDLDDTAFQWFRTSGNPAEDEIWNYHKGRNKKAVEIDSSDVYRKAVFECEVTINI